MSLADVVVVGVVVVGVVVAVAVVVSFHRKVINFPGKEMSQTKNKFANSIYFVGTTQRVIKVA